MTKQFSTYKTVPEVLLIIVPEVVNLWSRNRCIYYTVHLFVFALVSCGLVWYICFPKSSSSSFRFSIITEWLVGLDQIFTKGSFPQRLIFELLEREMNKCEWLQYQFVMWSRYMRKTDTNEYFFLIEQKKKNYTYCDS